MLPTFLIIGAQKAATTSLYLYLGKHPDIFAAEPKETNFFVTEGRWHLGRAWYESLFDAAGDALHRGEASPGYTFFPFYRGAPERAASLIPDARIIYVVRHPVERMVSAWAQAVSAGLEDLDIERALLYQANYVLASCYGLQISRWAACFRPEQILVVRSEDLATEPGSTLDQVLDHLGLAAGWRPGNLGVRYNPADDKRIARRPVRRVAAVLRHLGLQRAATALGPRTLHRLARPMRPDDCELSPDVAEAIAEVLRSDMAVLREFVGPDMDLWDLG